MSPIKFSAVAHSTAIGIACLLLYWWLDDPAVARSFVLGGAIYALPNLYFVYYAFRFRGAVQAPLIARSFSWGESGKFALAAMGFILAFRFVESLHHGALFAGFIGTMVLQWFVSAELVRRRDHTEKRGQTEERDESQEIK